MLGLTKTQIALIVVAVIAVIAALALLPSFLRSKALGESQAACDALKAQRSALSVQGGDAVEIARLDAQIRTCSAQNVLLGSGEDLALTTLTGCEEKSNQIEQEWAHYKTTSYTDPVKREGARGTILRLGAMRNTCYQTAIDEATTIAGIESVRNSIGRAITKSVARNRCHKNDEPGCGRLWGVDIEPHGNDKEASELRDITTPLRELYAAAAAKRVTLRTADET